VPTEPTALPLAVPSPPVAEGNAMSTPACIANAVADALGVAEISVPLTPERMLELLRQGSSAPRHKVSRR
jgi:2-furoyl-CoA dehydrogenase large subunit